MQVTRKVGGCDQPRALLQFNSVRPLLTRYRKILAGFPATIAFLGTSFVTVLPAPTIAFSPIVSRERTVAPDPIEAPVLTTVRSTFQSDSVCNVPSALVARGKLSLMNITP